MLEVNINLNEVSKIKSAFDCDEFSLTKREKTSRIAMEHNAVLAISGEAARFNEEAI